jgi:hypothetical protein
MPSNSATPRLCLCLCFCPYDVMLNEVKHPSAAQISRVAARSPRPPIDFALPQIQLQIFRLLPLRLRSLLVRHLQQPGQLDLLPRQNLLHGKNLHPRKRAVLIRPIGSSLRSGDRPQKRPLRGELFTAAYNRSCRGEARSPILFVYHRCPADACRITITVLEQEARAFAR